MAQAEFEVRRVPMTSTRDASKTINDMFADGYEPVMTQQIANDLVVIFRIKHKPGRPPKQEAPEAE
jgi:hypothetical protein